MDFLVEFNVCAFCQEHSKKVLNLESDLQVALRDVELLKSNNNILLQEKQLLHQQLNQLRTKIVNQKPRKYEQKPQVQIRSLQENIKNLELIVVNKDEIIRSLKEDLRIIQQKFNTTKDDSSIESSACSQTSQPGIKNPDPETPTVLQQIKKPHISKFNLPNENITKKIKST